LKLTDPTGICSGGLFLPSLLGQFESSLTVRLSSRLESSSKTLFRAKSRWSIGDGCVGLRSKLNLAPAEGVAVEADDIPEEEEELPVVVIDEHGVGGSIMAEFTLKGGKTEATVVTGVAGVDPTAAGVEQAMFLFVAVPEVDHFSYFSSKARSLSSNVMLAGSCLTTTAAGCRGCTAAVAAAAGVDTSLA
jgi:hypothetical protein